MNMQVRDRGAGMRLTERTREVDSRDKVRHTNRSNQIYVTRMMLVVEQE